MSCLNYGTPQVGETATYSAQYTIDQAASDSELVRNKVNVTADDPSGNEIEESDFVDTTTGASASIEVARGLRRDSQRGAPLPRCRL